MEAGQEMNLIPDPNSKHKHFGVILGNLLRTKIQLHSTWFHAKAANF
jgi:hypothetical protein